MDMAGVERIDLRAVGGADNIVVGDLTGTDLTSLDLDLGGPGGGGDGAADSITVSGTQNADVFGAAGDAGGLNVFGLHAKINILGQEQANDRLTLNGGLGVDKFLGSDGDDLVNGGDGDDVALLGAGDDTFVWNPGDDNDTLEGQSGSDKMAFNGANI